MADRAHEPTGAASPDPAPTGTAPTDTAHWGAESPDAASSDVVVMVGQARHDRDTAFTAFVAEHQGDLLRTAWLLVGDAHRAEELTQTALVRTYAAWPRAASGDPLAYARRVLVNLRIDTWRRRRREVLVAPEDLPDGVPSPGTSPRRSTADHQADRDQLVRALATLTARQRRVVVLRHLVGLPEAEVAEDLGVSVGTVKSTSSRALALLRVALADTPDAPALAERNPR